MRAADADGRAVDVMGRRREIPLDSELRRARDMAFMRMKASGYRVEDIARYHRVTPRHVFRRLAAMPDAVKRRVMESVI